MTIIFYLIDGEISSGKVNVKCKWKNESLQQWQDHYYLSMAKGSLTTVTQEIVCD